MNIRTIEPESLNGSRPPSEEYANLVRKSFLRLSGLPLSSATDGNTKMQLHLNGLSKSVPSSKPVTCSIRRTTSRNWLPGQKWTAIRSNMTNIHG